MSEPVNVGFIGLGELGHPMASRLTDLHGVLTVFDLDASKAANLVIRGARMASSVSHVAEMCDLVCVRVPAGEHVRSVVTELLFKAREGTTILVHSTVRPDTVAELAREAAVIGVHVLDAAVVGPPSAAEHGRLVLLVGGPSEQVEVARPVLDRMGDLVLHVGEAGDGTRAKLARKLLQHVAFAAAGEAARLAEAAGISPALLGHVVRHSDAVMGGPGSVLWRETTAPMGDDDPWRDVYGRLWAQGQRELHLAVELASELGVETPFADLALRSLEKALGFVPQPRSGAESQESGHHRHDAERS
jgi:3-hydroxyisobutyrate dehydrogenase-like beta-hydroxyacid dehydrogenase